MESSLDANNSESQVKVTRGHLRSNGLHCCVNMKLGGWSHLWMPKWNLNLIRATIVIWTWNLVWMETSLDAYNSEGQFKVTCGHLRTRSYSLSLLTWWMESPWMLTILKVSSRSPDVTQGLMAYHCCMDMKLGRWSHLRMPNIIKVNSRSPGVTHGQNPHTIPKQPNLVTTFAEPPFI